MTFIPLTAQQIQKQLEIVRDVFTSCPSYPVFANQLGVYHSLTESGYASILDLDYKLYIVHPSTMTVYASRVQGKYFEYITELLKNLQDGSNDVYVLSKLWKLHPFFVFVAMPAAFTDQAERVLASRYGKVHTAINHSPSEIFQLIEFKHFSGFSWRLTAQKHVDNGPAELYRKVNLSVRRGAVSWNDNNCGPLKMAKELEISPRFFTIANSNFTVVEELNRKQVNSMKQVLNKHNQGSISLFRGIFDDPYWCIAPSGPDPRVVIILKQSADGVIGVNNDLPEALKSNADMQHFMKQTDDQVVIMGRKTWESLPPQHRPLRGRVNLVVTRKTSMGLPDPCFDTIHKAVGYALKTYPDKMVFIIGGAEIYKAALDQRLVSSAIVTRIKETVMDKLPPYLKDKAVHFNIDPYLGTPDIVQYLHPAHGDKFGIEISHCPVNL